MKYAKLALSGLGGAIAAVLVCILSTPLMWKLEGVLGLELAGHSGPADGVILGFILVGFVVGIGARLMLASVSRNARGKKAKE